VSGFVKIYSTILDSSVWGESKDVRLLWVTMLAMTDQHGNVAASLGGLARRAGLTREECEVALAVLEAPDPDDRSGVDDGRRVRKTDGGWFITNHKHYRDVRTDKQVKDAERQARRREKGRSTESVTSHDVTSLSDESRGVATEAEADTEEDQTPPPKDLSGIPDLLSVGVVVPKSAEEKIPCPPDLKLTDAQRSQIQIGTGATDHQLDQLELRFRVTATTHEPRTRSAWQASIGRAVTTEFSNGRRRPPRSPDEETDDQRRDRLRRGPRQPTVLDHSTEEGHLDAIGGATVI
jgi:hypothetical protein